MENMSTLIYMQHGTRKFNGKTTFNVLEAQTFMIINGQTLIKTYYTKSKEFIKYINH